MSWERTRDTPERVVWERGDGYARIVARETASGTWSVSLDRLEQAPEGEAYRHESAPSRDHAIGIVDEWRLGYDTE